MNAPRPLLSLLALTLVLAAPVAAQPTGEIVRQWNQVSLADVARDDAILYLRFAGLTESARLGGETNFHRALASEPMRAFLAPLLKKLEALESETPERARGEWAAIKELAGGSIEIALQGSTILWNDRGEPMPAPGILVGYDLGNGPGDRETEVLAALRPLVGTPRGKPLVHRDTEIHRHRVSQGPVQSDLWRMRIGNLMVLGLNRFAMMDALDRRSGEGKSLASVAGLTGGRSHAPEGRVLEIFLHTAVLTDATSSFVPDELRFAMRRLGLERASGLYWSTGVTGGESHDTFLLASPAPHRGLLALGNDRPLSAELLALAPEGTLAFAATRFDIAGFHDLFMGIGEEVLPSRHMRTVRGALGMAGAAIGGDLRKDLLGSLGNEAAFFLAMEQGRLIPQAGLIVEVKDAERLQALLARALRAASVTVHETTLAGHAVWSLELPLDMVPGSPTLAFVEGRMIIGYSRASVAGVIERARSEGTRGLLANASFQETLGRDAAGAHGLVYIDAKRLAGYYLDAGANLAPGFLAALDLPLDVHAMPSAEDILPFVRSPFAIVRPTDAGLVAEVRGLGLGAVLALGARLAHDLPVPPDQLMRNFLAPMMGGVMGGMDRPFEGRSSSAPAREAPSRAVGGGAGGIFRDAVGTGSPAVASSAPAPTIVNAVQGQQREAAVAMLKEQRARIAAEPNVGSHHFQAGLTCIRIGQPADALAYFERARDLGHAPRTSTYNIVCCHSLLGQTESALSELEKALNDGWWNSQLLEKDSDLDAIRNLPRFKALVSRHTPR